MGQILHLHDFFPPLAQPDEVAEPQAAYDLGLAAGTWPAPGSSVLGLARELEAGCARLLAAAEAERPRGGPGNLDDIIEDLHGLERQSQDRFRPVLEAGGHTASREAAQVLVHTLESLRDCRWRLMALRADLHRAEGGPVFDSAEAMRRYAIGLSS